MVQPEISIVRIYSDGSARDGIMGFASVMYSKDKKVCVCGSEKGKDSNRAELLGFISALEMAINSQVRAVIMTDSEYIHSSIKKQHLKRWKSQGYHGVRNADLWIEADALMRSSMVTIEKIPRDINLEADRLSKLAVKEIYGRRSVVYF